MSYYGGISYLPYDVMSNVEKCPININRVSRWKKKAGMNKH